MTYWKLAKGSVSKACVSTLAATLLLGGCAARHTPGVWLNASFEELQAAFGDPGGVFINPAGNRVYAFALSTDVPEAPESGTPLVYGDAELLMEDVACVVTFELQQTQVTRWDWNEESCRSMRLPLPYETGAMGPMLAQPR